MSDVMTEADVAKLAMSGSSVEQVKDLPMPEYVTSALVSFATAAKDAIARKNMSVFDVAYAMKKDRASVSAYLKGNRNGTIKTFCDIADALGCNVKFVLEDR